MMATLIREDVLAADKAEAEVQTHIRGLPPVHCC